MEEESGSLPRKPLPLMAPILVLTQKLFPFSIFDTSEANGNRLSGDILRRKNLLSDVSRSLPDLLRRSTDRARRAREVSRGAPSGTSNFAQNAVAMTQQLNAMLVRMFKRQSVYAKRK